MLAAAGARLGREPAPRLDRQACESVPQAGIVHEGTQPLVGAVVDAQAVAVRQQHARAGDRHERRVIEQPGAGFGAEALADHEVAIAAHDADLGPGGGDRGDCRDDLAMRGLRIVVADPGFEQVAEQEQRACAPHGTGEKPPEAIGNVRRRRVEVQVRGEPGSHSAPLGCSGRASITYARRTIGRSTGTSGPKLGTVSVRM